MGASSSSEAAAIVEEAKAAEAVKTPEQIAEATQRILQARRTVDLILGVGRDAREEGNAARFAGYQYSHTAVRVFDDTNMTPWNSSADTWHPRIPDTVYWGMDWICPNDNKMLGDALRRLHGNITAETCSRRLRVPMNGRVWVAVCGLHASVCLLWSQIDVAAKHCNRSQSIYAGPRIRIVVCTSNCV